MNYNPNAARLLRELSRKDVNGDYTDTDILAGDGPSATKAKIRFLETILHERSNSFDNRIQKIKEIYALEGVVATNDEVWSLNDFKLSHIEFTLSSQERFIGYSATCGASMVTRTPRGTIVYPVQRGVHQNLDYVDITNRLVVYSNIRENFCGSFENFQFQQDYDWFKNFFETFSAK